jgi:hypothetical protein
MRTIYFLLIVESKTTHFNAFLLDVRRWFMFIDESRIESEPGDIGLAVEHFEDKHLIGSHFAQIMPFVRVLGIARYCVGCRSIHGPYSFELINIFFDVN